MRFLAVFLYVFRGYRPHLIKMPKGNALIFQLKKDFVFRAQPRFPEHGSVNWPWCAERKYSSLFLPISAIGMASMLKKITKKLEISHRSTRIELKLGTRRELTVLNPKTSIRIAMRARHVFNFERKTVAEAAPRTVSVLPSAIPRIKVQSERSED